MLQHRFYRRQPDLNVTNLAVRNEIAKIIGFWMELGLSGCLAPAREDPGPIRTALMGRPDSPHDAQWAVFARNHDELTLDKLSGAERQEVFAAFGPDQDMQVYGRGLRRRLPTMLGGDQRRIRLVHSLLLSLPGTTTLFSGEEIGMAENTALICYR